MKAYKIDVAKKEIYEVEISDRGDGPRHKDITAHLNSEVFDTVRLVRMGSAFDYVLVDDHGLLRPRPEVPGAFEILKYPNLLAGHGLVIGVGYDGATVSVHSPIGFIRSVVVFHPVDALPAEPPPIQVITLEE